MIYLDNAATTKPYKDALERAKQFNEDLFFNPSALYQGGLNNAREIRSAKESIIKNLSAFNHEVVFTSCGTESDNMAIFGTVKRGTFITTLGEHSAVYKSFLELKNKGLNVYFAPLNSDGSVNTESLYELAKSVYPDFVSVVHVNNETGAINDINAIARTLKQINPKLIFHSDGVQAYGKIPYKLSKDIDLYSVSAHKIGALKGTGALIKRKNLNVAPLIIGGGQENGLRSGTENIFGIKVFEFAGEIHYNNIEKNYNYVKQLKDRFIEHLDKDIFTIISSENSSPYVLTVSAIGLKGEVLMHSLENHGIIVGNGSACSSKNRFSRVIESCGFKQNVLDGVVRISFSKDTALEEVDFAVEKLNLEAKRLKGIM